VNTENEKAVRDHMREAFEARFPQHETVLFSEIYNRYYTEDGSKETSVWMSNARWEGYQAALQSQVSNTDGWVMVPVEVLDKFPELNTSNYNNDDVCELNAWGIELVLSAAPKAPQQVSNASTRDTDWVLAMAEALGTDSGYSVPIVPTAEAFRELFAAIRSNPPQQQEQSREATLVYALRAARPFVVLCDNCGDEGRKETLKLIDAAIGNDSSPATPTATASQESVPGQEPVAWIYAENAGKGREYITRAKPEWQNPQDLADAEVVITPLYLTPPTSTAIAAMVIKQAAEAVKQVVYSKGLAGTDTELACMRSILALTPANAEAELEALIATRVNAAVEAFRLAAIHALNEKSEEFKQLANVPVMTDVHDRYIQISNTYSNAALLIEALPGGAKALEDVCMKVAVAVAEESRGGIKADDYTRLMLRDIVQSVIRKG
jgi:hypothetical protein